MKLNDVFPTVDRAALATASGGFDINHALQAGNDAGKSATAGGAFLGGGIGSVFSGIAHYKGKITKMPSHAINTGMITMGVTATYAGLNYIAGVGLDAWQQLHGNIGVAPPAK